MEKVLLQQAIKLNKERKHRQWWRQLVRIMAFVVVFCTTYALILPAITMTSDPVCGLEPHAHDQGCYAEQPEKVQICVLNVSEEDIVFHEHDELCYDRHGLLVCTLEEKIPHEHTNSCYTDPVLICEEVECEAHTHGEGCVFETGPVCQIDETPAHIHTQECYGEAPLVCTESTNDVIIYGEPQLICNLPEAPAHIHNEDCVLTEEGICEIPETTGHSHDAACFGEPEEILVPGHVHLETCYGEAPLLCEIEETEGHTHTEECHNPFVGDCTLLEGVGHIHDTLCYAADRELICEEQILELHTHSDDCYQLIENEAGEEVLELVCTSVQVISHQHDETCFEVLEPQLICEIQEHEHTELCYPIEETVLQEEESPFLCSSGEHIHMDSCYDEDGNLMCTMPEHTHVPSCIGVDFDNAADVETEAQWAAMFDSILLTGNQPQDILSIANTQLNYHESALNCMLSGESLKYYSRYGAKYGMPYEAWNTLFVAFCLEYARVEGFPVHTDAAQWMQAVINADLFGAKENYLPKSGDVVFLDFGRMGIVLEVAEDSIQVIEGDVQGVVAICQYAVDDVSILGYGMIPVGLHTLVCEGEDYTVTVAFGPDAQIPENAVLDVREILSGTEEYEIYYQQSMQALILEEEAESADAEAAPAEEATESEEAAETEIEEAQPELEVTFARFFDIRFLVDGEKIEPAASVDVQIRYHEGIEVTGSEESVAVHFAEEGIEVLDAQVSQNADVADTFQFTQDSFSVSGTVLLAPRAAGDIYVWFDGTLGDLMSYSGAKRDHVTGKSGTEFTLPEIWDTSEMKYDYTLNGWYNIKTKTYHEPGEIVTLSENTVFYADWVATSYDIGQANASVVNTRDTSEFVTIDMYDYNVLMNMLSNITFSGNVGNSMPSLTWKDTAQNAGLADNKKGFIFRDWDNQNKITYPSNILDENYQWQDVIYNLAANDATQSNLLSLLFGSREVIGKTYVGSANYLFQYDDDPNSENFGYYYYDSALNAASYNKSDSRFYVYDYLERTTTDHEQGESDFLPFNSPYANKNGKEVVTENGVYVYDARDDGNKDAGSHVTSNYHFGMKTNIHFYLPNDAGQKADDYGNYGNLDINGNPMIFSFSGDDDVWVYIDDQLVLDIGGIHGIKSGEINFSTGKVYYEMNSSGQYEKWHDLVLSEGGHDLTIYYLERGSSLSNCAIYFNLAPRYGLELKKVDHLTGEAVNGVTFSVYTDEACTVPAKLWNSHDDAKNDKPSINSFTVRNGKAYMWGLVANKTYYIVENAEQCSDAVKEAYQISDDVIRLSLNHHGTDLSEVSILRGNDEQRTYGFDIVNHSIDEDDHFIQFTVSNPRLTEHPDTVVSVKVFKQWDENSVNIPDSISLRLLANGEQYGQDVTLTKANGWVHAWENLPEFNDEGPVTYTIKELAVPGFMPNVTERVTTEDVVDWLAVSAFQDGETYIIHFGNDALSVKDGKLVKTTLAEAKADQSAQWTIAPYGDGYKVYTGTYFLTLNNSSGFAVTHDTGNDKLYFDGTHLFGEYNMKNYYLSSATGGASQTPTTVEALKYEFTRVEVHQFVVTNKPIVEENQTFLKVKKVWDDSEKASSYDVTFRLLADGEDTGRTVTVNADSNWEGTFDRLLKGPVYTVEEEFLSGYIPSYSETKEITETVQQLTAATNLEAGKTYCITANGKALTANGNNAVSATTFNPDAVLDTQCWNAVKSGANIRLQNVSTNKYLKISSSTVSLDNSGSDVSLTNGKLKLGERYLTIGDTIGSSWRDGTALTTYAHTMIERSGYEITVTNAYSGFMLPETGGTGIDHFYVFGALLLLCALFGFVTLSRCKRSREGEESESTRSQIMKDI